MAENDCSGNKPVIGGTYTAHDGYDLAALNDGSDPNGTWTLQVYDMDRKKKGKLKDFALTFASSSQGLQQIAGLPSGSDFPKGTTQNTFVKTDSLGNSDTCSFTVTVEDNHAPVLQCANEVRQALMAEDFENGLPGSWTASGLWHASTGCGPAGAPNPSHWAYFGESGDCDYATGQHEAGSLISPSIHIPAGATDIQLNFDYVFDGKHSYGYDKASLWINGNYHDRYDMGPKNSWEKATADLTSYAGQTVILEFKFDSKDKYHNNYLGWIVDNIQLRMALPADANGHFSTSTMSNCEGLLYFEPKATDNCGIDTLYQISGLPSGSSFPIGTSTIGFMAKDASGNSTTCSFDISVSDQMAPVFSHCPTDITTCQNIVQWNPPIATDGCGAVSLSQTAGPTPGSHLSQGLHMVSYTATDTAGNTATCSFSIMVASLIADAGNDQQIYLGYGSGCAVLHASASGGDGNYTYNWSNGQKFGLLVCLPSATTTYTVAVSDGSGCIGIDSVKVEVQDMRCQNNGTEICYDGNTYCVSPWAAWIYTNFYNGFSLGSCTGNMTKKTGQPGVLPPLVFEPQHKEAAQTPLDWNYYPNPTSGLLSIEVHGLDGDARIQLMDASGKTLLVEEFNPAGTQSMLHELNLEPYAPGIYLIQLRTGNAIRSGRIVKE
ncbi:MAG: HYR domain-containing protein [Owenweeksia sp.]|nr:HYR domain-containing protein [Owenweeksia sp.]